MATDKGTLTAYGVICLCFLLTSVRGQTHTCKQLDACRCQYTDDGSIIDLTSVGKDDLTPRFKDVPSEDGYLYSYNPCKPFDEGVCKDAAVCKKDGKTGETLMTGHSDMPQFSYDETTTDTVIVYTAGQLAELVIPDLMVALEKICCTVLPPYNGPPNNDSLLTTTIVAIPETNKHTIVYLMCDKSDNPGPAQFFPNGTMDTNLFLLTMYSACACGGRCDANGLISSKTSALSVGSYICFGIVGVALLYFAIGAVIKKFAMNATGKDIVPNSGFWCGLPGQTKNGCRFVLSKCGMSVSYTDV